MLWGYLEQFHEERTGRAQHNLVRRKAAATGGQRAVDQVAMAAQRLHRGHQRGAVVAPRQAVQRVAGKRHIFARLCVLCCSILYTLCI